MRTPRKYVVGLTGGIGSGKSAAAKIFRALGVDVVDADALSREVVEPGQPALEEIVAHFGADIIASDGSLDRAALRKIVFSEPEQKAWLERLLHPQIEALIERRIDEAQSAYVVLESPLLLETKQHKLVDRILVIDVSEDVQLARSVRRDGSDTKTIRSIIASQLDRRERSRLADDLVLNEGSLELLKANIDTLHTQYTELANES